MQASPSIISIAALQGKLQRRFFKPWKTIAITMGDKHLFQMPLERDRLKTAVDFAANICATHNLDPNHILLKLNDDQNSDGCIVKAVGKPEVPLEIQLRSRLFYSSTPEPICHFVIAHEFGHILNGDTDDAKCMEAMANSNTDYSQLTPSQRRDLAHENHRVELAADETAVELFPSKEEGIAAGIKAFENRISETFEFLGYLSHLTGQKHTLASAAHRFHSHPTPQMRIRMLQRLAAQPE